MQLEYFDALMGMGMDIRWVKQWIDKIKSEEILFRHTLVCLIELTSFALKFGIRRMAFTIYNSIYQKTKKKRQTQTKSSFFSSSSSLKFKFSFNHKMFRKKNHRCITRSLYIPHSTIL